MTMVNTNTSFQIQSSEQPHLCIEVFKTLKKVGRLWLRPCGKSTGKSGIERQMFSVTNEGKLHPSTKPSSCLFLYNNNNLRYRKDCVGILHNEKNQFMHGLFDHAIFLMGDVTKVMTVRELEERKDVKLQKGSPTKSTKQQWTLRFESDRILQPADACNSSPATIPSSKYPPSPTSTQMPTTHYHKWNNNTPSPKSITPTKALPARYAIDANPPTTYQRITTRKFFNFYVYIWLKNNMKDEHASDQEKDMYHELVKKYG